MILFDEKFGFLFSILCICSFSKYLVGAYYEPVIVLGIGQAEINKTKSPPS